jgi:hypothetical protein
MLYNFAGIFYYFVQIFYNFVQIVNVFVKFFGNLIKIFLTSTPALKTWLNWSEVFAAFRWFPGSEQNSEVVALSLKKRPGFKSRPGQMSSVINGFVQTHTVPGWVHFTVFCYSLWTLGTVRGNLVFLPRFGILYQEKSGNPAQYYIPCNSIKSGRGDS